MCSGVLVHWCSICFKKGKLYKLVMRIFFRKLICYFLSLNTTVYLKQIG